MADAIPKLSNGDPSTLKTYRKIATILFPKALPMLDKRIENEGEDGVILAHETQMLQVLGSIEFGT